MNLTETYRLFGGYYHEFVNLCEPLDKLFQPLDKLFQPLDKPFQPLDKPFQPLDKPFQPLDKPFQPPDKAVSFIEMFQQATYYTKLHAKKSLRLNVCSITHFDLKLHLYIYFIDLLCN